MVGVAKTDVTSDKPKQIECLEAIPSGIPSTTNDQTYQFTTIDFAGADAVQARGINNQGDIVGYRTVGGVTESFLQTSAGEIIFQLNSESTFGLGINDLGDTAGGVATAAGQDAFLRYEDATSIIFQPDGNDDANANGINNAGSIVGSGNAFGTGGYLRETDGTITSIDFVGGAGETILKTNATDINNSGWIMGHAIGQDSNSDFFGRGWFSADNGASFIDIAQAGEQFTYLWAGNDTGLLVGDYSTGFTGDRTGFVYDVDSGTFNSFNVQGADWTVPTGINDAGQIVGFSRDASTSRITGFIAVAIPEPTVLPFLSVFGLIAGTRRRKIAAQ
jgi:hypothetical protein